MSKKSSLLFIAALIMIGSFGCSQKSNKSNADIAIAESSVGQQEADLNMKEEFIKLCDSSYMDVIAQTKVTERLGARGFYWDSYAVRALCVGYDLTGKKEYLDACKLWSDRMIEFQEQMIPEGAYYMLYGRKPGEKEGNWFSADCSSIALGVLATAARCSDPNEKERLLNSVKSFSSLVSNNFVKSSGGVSDGYWPASDDEWWCSTGIYGSLAFQLYKETGDEAYLKLGSGTIDWLNQIDFLTVATHFPKKEILPVVMIYCLEAYSTAFPFLDKKSEQYELAIAQWNNAFVWMKENQQGKYGMDYVHQWGSKFGGLPFHMYHYADFVPGNESLVKSGDEELSYCMNIIKNPELSSRMGEPEFYEQLDQLAIFTMFSYAQRVSPGTIYRTSNEPVK